MSQIVKIILIFNIAIWNSFAMASDCQESVTLLDKGTPAPCTGFLFSPDAEAQAASDARDAKYYKLINEKLELRHDLMLEQNEILDKRLKLYMDQSHTLATELHKKESRSTWEKVGWFVLGIGVTGLAIYGAGQLNN
jgi:hypothetical protein